MGAADGDIVECLDTLNDNYKSLVSDVNYWCKKVADVEQKVSTVEKIQGTDVQSALKEAALALLPDMLKDMIKIAVDDDGKKITVDINNGERRRLMHRLASSEE